TWSVRGGPSPVPLAEGRPCWWMSLHLCSFGDRLLLFGMVNTGALAWALFAQGRWSTVTTATVSFATTRPLAYARRGTSAVDIVGIGEDGVVVGRSLIVAQTAVNLGVADNLPS